jgi:hypothetical protein
VVGTGIGAHSAAVNSLFPAILNSISTRWIQALICSNVANEARALTAIHAFHARTSAIAHNAPILITGSARIRWWVRWNSIGTNVTRALIAIHWRVAVIILTGDSANSIADHQFTFKNFKIE